MAREVLLGPLARIFLPTFVHCLSGKAVRKPFEIATRASIPLQLIHSDICGPMHVRTRHGDPYFITFIDACGRHDHVYLIYHKSEALDCFRLYVSEAKSQLDKSIKSLKTDYGCVYRSKQVRQLCEVKGILRQLTIYRTLQQNGVAERRNHTLLVMVRSITVYTNFPISYWGDALLTTAFILN